MLQYILYLRDYLLSLGYHLFSKFNLLFYIELTSKIVLIVGLIIGGALFLRKSLNTIKKSEVTFQKYFSLGIALFGFSYALTRVFFIFSDFLFEMTYEYLFFWRLAAVAAVVSIIFLEAIIETYLIKTHYIFTVLAIIGAILIAVLDLGLARLISYTFLPLLALDIVGIYLYVALKSEGVPRTKALQSMFGILILVAGIVIDGTFVMNFLGFDTGIIGTIVMLIGFVVFFKANY